MQYIEEIISVKARFSEVDAMGVVWHGNYLKYFEDGREYLGEKHGMSYKDIGNHGYFVPIVHTDISYKSPVTFGDNIRITCRLIKNIAAKLIYQYEVINLESGKLSCVGKTTQAFIDKETMELSLNYPDFYLKWMESIDWISE